MISSKNVIPRLAVAVVVLAAFTGLAHSQTTTSIPTPASSSDSGSRAVVSIVVPTTSYIQDLARMEASAAVPSGSVCGSPGAKKTVPGYYSKPTGGSVYNPTGWPVVCGGSEVVVTGYSYGQNCAGNGNCNPGLWVLSGSCPSSYSLKGSSYYSETGSDGGGYGGGMSSTTVSGVDAWCQKN